jgi:hypothetical protein
MSPLVVWSEKPILLKTLDTFIKEAALSFCCGRRRRRPAARDLARRLTGRDWLCRRFRFVRRLFFGR